MSTWMGIRWKHFRALLSKAATWLGPRLANSSGWERLATIITPLIYCGSLLIAWSLYLKEVDARDTEMKRRIQVAQDMLAGSPFATSIAPRHVTQSQLEQARRILEEVASSGLQKHGVHQLSALLELVEGHNATLEKSNPLQCGDLSCARHLYEYRGAALWILWCAERTTQRKAELLDNYASWSNCDPDSAYPVAVKASLLISMGDLDGAGIALDDAIKRPANRSTALEVKARLYKARKQPAEAEATFKAALEADPFNLYARINLGQFLTDENRDTESELYLQQAISIGPPQSRAHYGLAILYIKQSKLEQALREVDRALELDREEPFTHVARAQCLVQLRRFPEAVDAASTALGLDRRSPGAYLNRAIAERELGDPRRALEDVRRGLEDPGTEEGNLHLEAARDARELHDNAAEESEAKLACAQLPNSVLAWVLWGHALMELHQSPAAIEALKHALTIDTKCSDAYALIGLMQADDPSKEVRTQARDMLHRAVGLGSHTTQVYIKLSGIHVEEGELQSALVLLENGRAILTVDAELCYELGKAYHRLGRMKEAGAQYRLALGSDRDYVKAWFELSAVLLEMGSNDEALSASDELVGRRPGSAQARALRARALHALGRHGDALVSAELALTFEPGNKEYLELRDAERSHVQGEGGQQK